MGFLTTPILRLCVCARTYPSLSEGTLQFWQLGRGTPGLSDQAFVCHRRAAEVQHHLDRLTLLHAHLPLRKHRHRSHQQLLQVGLSLGKHLGEREVRAACCRTAHLLKQPCLDYTSFSKPYLYQYYEANLHSTQGFCVHVLRLTDLISSILPWSPWRISSLSAWLSG